jgi:hypothetical protein
MIPFLLFRTESKNLFEHKGGSLAIHAFGIGDNITQQLHTLSAQQSVLRSMSKKPGRRS